MDDLTVIGPLGRAGSGGLNPSPGWMIYIVTDPRNTATWRKLVKQLTAAATTCAVCGGELRKTDPPRTGWRPSVDHVFPLADYPHLAHNRSNLRVVHIGCNSRLSNQARLGHPDRIGGTPQPWRHRTTATSTTTSRRWSDPGPGPGW